MMGNLRENITVYVRVKGFGTFPDVAPCDLSVGIDDILRSANEATFFTLY